jgi:hypothetical protein
MHRAPIWGRGSTGCAAPEDRAVRLPRARQSPTAIGEQGDSYRVRVPRHPYSSEMIWVDIPKDAVITEPNRAGRTLVWPVWVYGSGV